jgi:hypothetical protein
VFIRSQFLRTHMVEWKARLAPVRCFGTSISFASGDFHGVESPIPRIDAAAAIVVSPRRRIIMVSVIGFA